MRAIDIIEKKKQGKELSKVEIQFLIDSYITHGLPDYQMAAFLMAVWFRGLSPRETTDLTTVMMHSGDIYNLSMIDGPVVDKHSTGGVGDKVSLVLGPILAALGLPVAKMSGRGLGITGGTLDKLESIPGFQIHLTRAAFVKQLQKIGLVIVGQDEKIVPADKLLYALRDVTGTVDSLPLIASSIMAKKLAIGANAILLDVKCGDGAFMKDLASARRLAQMMITIGQQMGRKVCAEITSMAQPLGTAIGNRNEVLEAIATLQGAGSKDFMTVVKSSCATLLQLTGRSQDAKDSARQISAVISSGQALAKFYAFVQAQGGDVDALTRASFWQPQYAVEVLATSDGFMEITSAAGFGLAAMQLGAGRETKDAAIDFDAGINFCHKTGDQVQRGDLLFTCYSSNPIRSEVIDALATSYRITDRPRRLRLVLERLA